ncbi:MAG: hypothetical protein H5U24_13110 [Thioclava marina]|uniref:hypothetical protein n=1 Tax=Thioclava marina TaxID=1915077 RepID=UPI0019B2522D|nr:hypothetical protein [Thioclava marina]MBC7146330.1 hypothetical protein [Thioclava marina]
MSPSSPAPAPSATTTIVTCIEAGFMERQVPLLVKSLRRFDHVLARAQVLAIQPRKGPAISGATRRELKTLGIEHVRADLVGSYAWYNNLNKSAAMAWADRNCTTDFITWLDADMVFLGPTPEVVPGLDTSFVARAGEGYLGSDGADRNAPYWERISQIVGVDYKAAEIIESLPEGRPIYEYYQSGVYSQARRDGIGIRHLEFMKKVLDAAVGSIVARNYHYDQVTISMAAAPGAACASGWPGRTITTSIRSRSRRSIARCCAVAGCCIITAGSTRRPGAGSRPCSTRSTPRAAS